MIQALKRRAIARLWLGQALSTVGDEIYRVGLTWLAVGLIGADAGYLNAGQAGALMILSFIGGHWADRWSPLKTMVFTDMVRAGVVLIPVIWYQFSPVTLGLLWFVSLTLASLSAFFEPAMHAMLPRLARDRELLGSTTGLMSTTFRMARMVGPTVVGILSSVIPMIHFFSVDAISFLISALSLNSLALVDPEAAAEVPAPAEPRGSMWDAVRAGFIAVRKRAGVTYYFVAKSITGGSWGVVMGLGIALLVRQMTGEESVRDFGLAIGSYGLGNFLGALVFGNAKRGSPHFAMMAGYIWLGVVFVVIGLAPTISVIMIAAAIGGFSGPMNDLGFIDMVQTRFELYEILRVIRLRIAVETGSALVCMLIAPSMIRMFGVRAVIVFCGFVWILCGSVGLSLKPAPEP